jgi:serine/threonine-protein kinase
LLNSRLVRDDEKLRFEQAATLVGLPTRGSTQSSLPVVGRPRTPTPIPGVIADRYEVIGVLGAGAMGRVFRVFDRALDEVVALKLLRRELVGVPGMVERFRREVKLARRVTSKHVVRTFDLGEHAGAFFLTMEQIDGQALARHLAAGRLSVPETMRIACAVAEGIAAAHATGVVHLDLKPDNVLVGNDGRIAVTDFGIASIIEVSPRDSFERSYGTPAYMAPEQMRGGTPIGPPADVYAFGAMMFEMLTGRQPFTGEDALKIAHARLEQPPPDPRSLCQVPDPHAELVLRCLAREPAERFADGRELLHAVTALDPMFSRASLVSIIGDESFDLYHELMSKLRAAWQVGGVEALLADLEAMLARDENDARLLPVLSLAHARSAFYGGAGQLERAASLADRAVRLVPTLGEAWLAAGVAALYGGDPTTCARALGRAVAIAPGLAMAHALLGALALEAGALDSAIRVLKLARSLDPGGLQIADLPRALVYAGRTEDAERMLRETPTHFREITIARFRMWKHELYEMTWNMRADGLPSDFDQYASVAFRVHSTGKLDATDRVTLDRMVRVPNARLRATRSQFVVELLSFVGELDAAMHYIEESVAAGLHDWLWCQHCPLLDPLRARPRFRELAATVEVRARAVMEALEEIGALEVGNRSSGRLS